jgi:hypothetical protein
MKSDSFQRYSTEMKFWPDPVQELLLRAALLPGAAAGEAFRKWLTLTDRDRLDQGSYRMLPLLVHNLSRQGIRDPFLNLCLGVHRHTWVRNQMQLSQTRELLKEFRLEGIPVMLLKGAALALAYYADCGLRPFEDIDLLVPTGQAQPAFALLCRLGWSPCRFPVRSISPEYAGITHAVVMVNERGLVVDLHWHLLSQCLSPDADSRFWRDSVPVDKESNRLYMLSPTDQLFHACVHGYKHQVGWEHIPPIRWVADALHVMAAKVEQIDYLRLGCLARELHLGLALKLTLGYLRDRLEAPLPESLISEMAEWPVSAWERAELRTQQKSSTILGSLPIIWHRYRRLKRNSATGPALQNFASYLQHFFHFQHRRDVFVFLASKGIRNLGRWFRSKLRLPLHRHDLPFAKRSNPR